MSTTKTKKSQNENTEIKQESTELQEARKALADRKALPSGEEVEKWFTNDLRAAITALHLVLESPEALKNLVHAIYNEQAKEEQKIIERLEERIKQLEEVE